MINIENVGNLCMYSAFVCHTSLAWSDTWEKERKKVEKKSITESYAFSHILQNSWVQSLRDSNRDFDYCNIVPNDVVGLKKIIGRFFSALPDLDTLVWALLLPLTTTMPSNVSIQ